MLKLRTYIPNSVKHWKVFEYDQQIKRFLEVTDEFVSTRVDGKNQDASRDEKENGVDDWDPDPK